MGKKKSAGGLGIIYLVGMLAAVVGFCLPMFTIKGDFGASNGFKFINFDNSGFVTIGALLLFIGAVAGAVFGLLSVLKIKLPSAKMLGLVALIVVLANVIKRLSFDFSWQVALAVSAISGLIVIVIGASALDADVSIVGAIVSMLISTILIFVMQLFVHNIDYSRAEYVQFQDDEYFYYVKAIPRYGVDTGRRRGGRQRE